MSTLTFNGTSFSSLRRLQGFGFAAFAFFLAQGTVALGDITVYSGRSKSLVDPIVKQFETESKIKVNVRYGDTPQLAVALLEEKEKSPADVFWSQEAGALGEIAKAGLLKKLPKASLGKVPDTFRSPDGLWVASSGRARTLAYSAVRLKPEDLPKSYKDLTDPKWKGKIGWAPTNASFQAFVTALRVQHGEHAAKDWLVAMKANEPKVYAKNTAIVKAIADGEIDLGLPNNYYLLRFKKADEKFPVEQTFFAPGDTGNLVNIAGVGILKSSKKSGEAQKFVDFLLSAKAQQYFTSDVLEYPVTEAVIPNTALVTMAELQKVAPKITLDKLHDLTGTLKMLQDSGLL